jgi:chromate transporter
VQKPDWKEFAGYWLKFGFVSFGGPVAQIGILHRDLVDKRQWLSEEDFSQALAFVSILPGPEAHQLATYIGKKHYGVKGGVVAGGLFLLPSLFLISLLTWIYLNFSFIANMGVFLDGLRSGVLALILYTTFRLGRKVDRKIQNILFGTIFFFLGVALNIPIIFIVLLAIFIGYGLGRTNLEKSKLNIEWQKTLKYLSIGFLVWLISFALVYQDELLRSIGILFTQAALITFGGAYSVVPFVSQAAVDHYGWLTQAQMLDGIALGETTPGPLIMINAFVGFIAYKGFIGALTATWFTFLPSFVLVFAGWPIIKSISGNQRLQTVLEVISIAVVTFVAGFAVTIFQSLSAETKFLQLLLSFASLVLLIKTRINVVWVLFGCAGLYSLISIGF